MSQEPRRAPRSKAVAAGLFACVSALAGVVVAAIALPGAGAFAATAKSAVSTYDNLPTELTTPPLPQKTTMHASNGEEIAVLYSQNRTEVPLDQVAPVLQHAVVAIEDSRFYDHNGVDMRGTARALANNAAGQDVQGASTLTMQYVKNLLLTIAQTPEQQQAATAQTASRKLQEMRYAVGLEQQLGKPQILNNYLNISYFGAGAYGVEAAAQRYFSKSAADVNLVEAATLAGVTQSPNVYDPLIDQAASEKRRNIVLLRMLELGYIDRDAYDEAKATPVASYLNPSTPKNGCASSAFPYFCDFVMKQFMASPAFGASVEDRERLLETGGLKINTTLDIKDQVEAQDRVYRAIPIADPSGKAAAVALVQPGTGNVVAMAQNRIWGTEGEGATTFNYAVDQQFGGTIGMQAGSTFKIFTIANAIEKGINPYERINAVDDLQFPAGDWGCPGENFEPFEGRNSTVSGTLDMWQGTAYSTNTYFLQREKDSGLCDTVHMAERAGIAHSASGDPLQPVITFTLGTTEVSPLSMANAYATFAAHGLMCQPRSIENVTKRDGGVMENPPACAQTIAPDVADATTAILSGVIDGPISGRSGGGLSLGRDAAGKTGTTDSQAAVWFAGYTPDLAGAVWVGDPRGGFQYPMRDVTINGRFYEKGTGAEIPGPIWQSVMQGALNDEPATSFKLNSKFGLQPVTQGGGPDPAKFYLVAAYQEYLANGRYNLRSADANGNSTVVRSVRPTSLGPTPSFSEFSNYYYNNGGPNTVPEPPSNLVYEEGSEDPDEDVQD